MMLTFILLSYFSVQYLVIYANPLYQNYGTSCQCQQNPWYPPDLIFEPTNVDPYAIVHQSSPLRNQSPYSQEYVNKIFSNPSLKAILDPNTKLFDVNGVEIPRVNPELCPNVINNYIIIPPEVLADQRYPKQNGERKNKSNRRKVKTDHKNNIKNGNSVENQRRKANNHKLKQRKNNSNNPNDREPKVNNKIANVEIDTALKNSGDAVKEKDKVIRLKIITHPTNQREEAVVQEFRKKFPGIPEELVRSLLKYLKRKLSNGEIGISDENSYISSNGKSQKQATKNKRKNPRRKGRKRKDQKKGHKTTKDKYYETNLETSTHSLYDIKENITINNTTTTYSENEEMNSTGTEIFVTPKILPEYETIVETTTAKSVLDEDFQSVNFDFAKQNVIENSQHVIEQNEKGTEKFDRVFASEDSNEIEQDQEKGDENSDHNYKPDTDGHKLDYNYNVDNTRVPELGTEDEVPITVNSLFEDYYPDFRVISNEDFTSPDSQQAINTELSRGRRKYEQNYDKNHYTNVFLNKEKVYETDEHEEEFSDAPDGSVPVSMTLKKESEEVTFIAPPGLEKPDFETKNIKELNSYYEKASKYEPKYKYSDISDKTSFYSNAKSPKYDKGGSAWKKDKQKDLETVFARSKVVKYGQNPDEKNVYVIAESYPDYEW